MLYKFKIYLKFKYSFCKKIFFNLDVQTGSFESDPFANYGFGTLFSKVISKAAIFFVWPGNYEGGGIGHWPLRKRIFFYVATKLEGGGWATKKNYFFCFFPILISGLPARHDKREEGSRGQHCQSGRYERHEQTGKLVMRMII